MCLRDHSVLSHSSRKDKIIFWFLKLQYSYILSKFVLHIWNQFFSLIFHSVHCKYFYNSAYKILFFSFIYKLVSQNLLSSSPFLSLPVQALYLPSLNYNILDDVKEQTLFSAALLGPSTVPDLVMLNYCWANKFYFCFDK